jgi:cytidylate kinase
LSSKAVKYPRIIIAIDGFAGGGKSTLAKSLASRLGYRYIDTGAMYRAVTLYFQREGIEFTDPGSVEKALKSIRIAFSHDNNHTLLNGEDVEELIRSPDVNEEVSEVSALTSVRNVIRAQQQMMGNDRGVVMEGRDIGTVVFPDAELKIFLSADLEERVQRRHLQLQERGTTESRSEVLKNLRHRDFLDTNREDSPLRRAPDAIEVDTTEMDQEEVLQRVYEIFLEKIVD